MHTKTTLSSICACLCLALTACGPSGGGGDDGHGTGSNGGGGPQQKQSRIEGYLQNGTYEKLEIETDWVEGKKPRSSVRSELASEFEDLLKKPDGVSIPTDSSIEPRGSDHTWTFEELDQLARNQSKAATDGKTTRMYTVFVDGSYEEDDGDAKVLGLAWRNRYMAIFKENIEESCQGATGIASSELCKLAVKSIWTHEIGHTLGLVDNGVEPQADHHDEEHGKHCDNDECVMYWKYEQDNLIGALRKRLQEGDASALDFGKDCRDDLASVRKK